VDVRVIAASNRDLHAEVSKGTFREDLFYRLNVIPLVLPALRDRRDDIPLLIDFFIRKVTIGKKQKTITPEAERLLMQYRWPGNVRELENTIERMTILTTGDAITAEQVPDTIREYRPETPLVPAEIPDEGLDLEALLGAAEKRLLHSALEKAGGVKTEAAKLLGLTFRSFRHRIRKYDPR
jgi:two-component system response regulator PilR (NtrC family)